jgi:hypothetical protein
LKSFNDWSDFSRNQQPGNKTTLGQHLRGLMVFHNPMVSSLERHLHLFAGFGCFSTSSTFENQDGGVNCTEKADVIPESFRTLMNCVKKHTEAGACPLEANGTLVDPHPFFCHQLLIACTDRAEKKEFKDLNWHCTDA